MNLDLTRHFQAETDRHRLRHLTLVGAEYEMDGHTLSLNDRAIIRIFSDMMSKLKIPMSNDIATANDILHHLAPASFDVVNLAYGQGNFVRHAKQADVVIFCNLPVENAARPGPMEKELPQWRDALERSGANIAWISGVDSFTTEDIKGTDYIPVKTDMAGQSFLIKRDYFESIEEYIHYSESPLYQMIRPYFQNANTSFVVAPNRSSMKEGEWNAIQIRPQPIPRP